MTEPPKNATDRILEEARRYREERERGYREQALKLFPHICASCGREFSGRKLKELTVHHKDHNHENNPVDGSNWELLCLYCHDNEHERQSVADASTGVTAGGRNKPTTTHNPFAALEGLLRGKK